MFYNYIVCNSIFGLKSTDAKIKQAFITVHLVSFSHSGGPFFPKGAPATPGVLFGFLGFLVVGTGFLVALLPTLFCVSFGCLFLLSFFFAYLLLKDLDTHFLIQIVHYIYRFVILHMKTLSFFKESV